MTTTGIPYRKYHGTGNDFFVIDESDAAQISDRRQFAMVHCDRARGTGADGVLFVEDRGSRVAMQLFQPDGSTAEMCGNGARCVARWTLDRRKTDGPIELTIETDAGPRHAIVDRSDATIEMGVPSFDPVAIPLDSDEPMIDVPLHGLSITAVNTGVPHAVAVVSTVDTVDLETLGPRIRSDSMFPAGTNVTLAAPRPNGGYDQRTFERGVEDETRSCGTGAVAILAVARKLGITTARTALIYPPGGELEITIRTDGTATLSGPVTFEEAGTLEPVGVAR